MVGRESTFETVALAVEPDAIAPDGSEIRLLGRVAGASMAHGTLPPGGVSLAVTHRTVEEIWYVLAGEAEIWRMFGDDDRVVAVRAGMSITIPVGTHFQFRTRGSVPFQFIMCTIPPWPGDGEAVRVADRWPVDQAGKV
ncbi:MAG: cupin domain-containing protein [Thermomicrobiales bacterium]|nr:cupin domain-containing protein [Thermomicrobiales bacterium]